MSVVVAVRSKGKGVIVGADSAIISSDDQDTIIALVDPELNPKIMKQGPYVVAGVGSPRMLNVLRQISWPDLLVSARKSLEQATAHVVSHMIPVLQEHFSSNQIAMEQVPGATIYNGQFIIAFDEYLFDVGPDLSVVTYDIPYVAIGGGARLATGGMHVALQATKDPEEQLLLALKAASFHSTLCSGPFTIMKTTKAK